jgi:orotate phosphoribosyltransferase
MPVSRDELMRIFRKTKALQRGHFELSSGQHSGHYFQCALFLQHPQYATSVSREIAAQFRSKKPEAVVGLAVGGLVLAHEVARALKVRAMFTERAKGNMSLRRGFTIEKGERILLVEDVITTGDSVREVAMLLKTQGAVIVGVGAIMDRSNGTAKIGKAPVKSLVKLQMESFSRAQCPLCKEGWDVTKPGSRHNAQLLDE